ncbi:hypothetical protein NLI96_g7535 [Meripilus lineatus]|uniref:Peptidase A1 domain-containing protein n=1 Tax=Meripilus lineatus TaxID=2056292 RepID=A0AAD5V484_9APHY|nr:hypothetical protein NLI96_g7535 [Physisporinus lineatus]
MPYNGQFGLVQEALGSFGSHNYSHLFTDLYRSGELIDPVIGMRLDPANPRLTVGALNSEDYEGTLNWVEIVPNKHNFTQSNVFEFDGFRSRDLPLGPFTNSTPMLTAVDTKLLVIAIPNNLTVFLSSGLLGSINESLKTTSDVDGLHFLTNCSLAHSIAGKDASPDCIDMSVAINGVSYEIESRDLLQGPPNHSQQIVGIGFNTLAPQEPQTILGLPFLRSVYLAYRFPTDSCPGYFGFAFPRGANRTQEQIAQKPQSTPALSSQCLSFAAPTSTPSPLGAPLPVGVDGKQYSVYGNDSLQVQLIGADQLVKGVWNVTNGKI